MGSHTNDFDIEYKPLTGFPAEPFKPFKPFKTFFFRANLFFQQKKLLKPFKPFFLANARYFPIFSFIFIYKKKNIYMGYKIDCLKFLPAPSALAYHQHSLYIFVRAVGDRLLTKYIGMVCY